MASRLWLKTELAFMYVRRNPDLDIAAVGRVIAAAFDEFDGVIDDTLGGVRNAPTPSPLDEPALVAARMTGASLAARSALDRGATENAIDVGCRLGQAVLGREAVFDEREQGRLARGVYSGIAACAEAGAATFGGIAERRPAAPSAITVIESGEVDADPEVVEQLRRLRNGESVAKLLDLTALRAVDVGPAGDHSGTGLRDAIPSTLKGDLVPQRPATLAGMPAAVQAPRRDAVDNLAPVKPDADLTGNLISHRSPCATAIDLSLAPLVAFAPDRAKELRNARLPFSAFWEEFGAWKVEQGEWQAEEQLAARNIPRLVVDVLGDRPLTEYTASEMRKVRKVYLGLPAKYAQANPWKRIYEDEGPSAVVAASKDAKVKRTTQKSWNKLFSRLSGVFDFGRSLQGDAMPCDAVNPCDGLVLKRSRNERKLTPAQRNQQRRVYFVDELVLIFNAPKFLGASSSSRWKLPGPLVVRDHRYWLVLIAFLHGNRRGEPATLKVKHVKRCPETGIWYFDFEDLELIKHLKASGSPRLLPLHWMLIAMGFLEARVHGRDPEDRLFPEAESAAEIGADAGPVGQWYLHFRRSLGIMDTAADFHAIRTTVMNLLEDANVSRAIIEALCGWESSQRRSTLDEYRRDKRLTLLKEAVDKIVMPIDLPAYAIAVTRSNAINPGAADPDLKSSRKWKRTINNAAC